MIFDLQKPDCPANVSTDFCIIGSGAAGSYLASRLASLGHDVVVLEAGPAEVIDVSAAGFEPIIRGMRYGGVYEGRGFGLGGTSALWGGALIPHDHTDVRSDDPRTYETWKTVVERVSKHVSAVRRTIGLETPTDFDTRAGAILGPLKPRLESLGLSPIISEMIPFRMRNLSRLIPGDKVRVFVNAAAAGFTAGEHGNKLTQCQAVSRNSRTLSVRAHTFVVAAGAIESARVLLELDRSTQGALLTGRDSIGVGLSDHLSVRGADVLPESLPRAAQLFAPHFDGSVLRAVRLRDTTVAAGFPRHFTHLVFPIENPGFQLAKNVLGSLQKKAIPKVSVTEAAEGFAGLTALAFGRFAKKRLHVPADTETGLQLDIEQTPSENNYVRLSESERDPFGRPRGEVSWSIAESDLEHLRTLQTRILAKWSSIQDLPRLTPVPVGTMKSKLHDSYHPVGTCRMGTDAASVLDLDLRVRGTDNLYIMSTGALPTAGSANPTLTLLCLTEEFSARSHRT